MLWYILYSVLCIMYHVLYCIYTHSHGCTHTYYCHTSIAKTHVHMQKYIHTACILYVRYPQCVRMKLPQWPRVNFPPQKLWPDRDYTICMGKPYTWLDTNTTQSPLFSSLFWRTLRCWGWITEQPVIEGTGKGWALSVSFHPSYWSQVSVYHGVPPPSGEPQFWVKFISVQSQ